MNLKSIENKTNNYFIMKRFTYIFAIAASVAAVASCTDPIGQAKQSTVYITTGRTPADEINIAVTFDALTQTEELVGLTDIQLGFRSTEAVEADITADIKVDEGKVSGQWKLLPAEAYEITNATASILKGAEEAAVPFGIKIKPEAVKEAGMYVLPVTFEVKDGNAVPSSSSAYVNVRLMRSVVNTDAVPEGWARIPSDKFTAAAYEGYAGLAPEAVAYAFDGDIKTEWYSYAASYDSENDSYTYADDWSSYYGCYAEVTFSEPVEIAGLIVSISQDSDYYGYRARRLSVMFKYEGEEYYTWDKTNIDGYQIDENGDYVTDDDGNYVFDYNVGDDGYYRHKSLITTEDGANKSNDITAIPEYQPSPADFVIDEPLYTSYAVNFAEKTAGRKVASIVICPAKISCYQDGWCDEVNDFWYSYYYDYMWGTSVGEIFLFGPSK